MPESALYKHVTIRAQYLYWGYPWNYANFSSGWPDWIGVRDTYQDTLYDSSTRWKDTFPSSPPWYSTLQSFLEGVNNSTWYTKTTLTEETFPPPTGYQFTGDPFVWALAWAGNGMSCSLDAVRYTGEYRYRESGTYIKTYYKNVQLIPEEDEGAEAIAPIVGSLLLMGMFLGASSPAPARRRRTA